MDQISIKYYFLLESGAQKSLAFQFEPLSPFVSPPLSRDIPEWTRLEYYQCPNCPFRPEDMAYCPLALNLVDIIKRFDGHLSYEKVYLKVVMPDREVSKKTTVQHGVSSLMGLAIAASGCPHTSFFAPMAHFHVPLASVQETVFRAVSSYLLSQYFLKKDGEKADFDLDGLTQIYKNLQVVNISIAGRLRSATESDSSVNAIILLDTYAQALPIVLETSLEDIKAMYAPYYACNAQVTDIKAPGETQKAEAVMESDGFKKVPSYEEISQLPLDEI